MAGWLGGLIDAVQEPAGLDALVIGTDAPVAAALEAMRGCVSFLKLLGAYPRALV